MPNAEQVEGSKNPTNGSGTIPPTLDQPLRRSLYPETSPSRLAASKIKATSKKRGKKSKVAAGNIAFPKHSPSKCLRIPQAVLEQNAGNDCTDRDAAKFAKLKYHGELGVEISSALKFGWFERPTPGRVKPTELTRKAVRPQKPNERLEAMREAVLKAPVISDVYKHYRGENLPEREFLINTVTETFKVPSDRADAFVEVFRDTLKDAQLLEETGEKERVIDVTHAPDIPPGVADEQLRKIGRKVSVQPSDTCFVVMPFAVPLGAYYASIYEPAIVKAGLTPIRADTDIFGTGKIIDKIWSGINSSRVLVAELTGRNPNVLYELGLAHALKKPVVLVSSNEQDVPFDVRHVRVIYYDVSDPFWGTKLIDKVAENILSALKNPTEAILFPG